MSNLATPLGFIRVCPDHTAPEGSRAGCHSRQTCDTVDLRAAADRRLAPGEQSAPLFQHSAAPRPTLQTSASTGVGMFDAFIINRIRRERQQEQERRIPLHIEAPRRREPPADHERRRGSERETDSNRGVVIIDYSI